MAGPRRSEEARFLLLTRNGPSCLKQHSSVPHSALVKQWVAAYTQRKDKIQKFATLMKPTSKRKSQQPQLQK